jgi:hypothetical protein
MPKMSEYQVFRSHVAGLNYDELPKDEMVQATSQEVGYWKKFQFERAIQHARSGKATMVELNYLRRHGVYHSEVTYSSTWRRDLG